jgi:hypothetical protein
MRSLRSWLIGLSISGLSLSMTACSSESGSIADPPTTTAVASPSVSASESGSDDADRGPEGDVSILSIDQETRDQLRTAAGGDHAPDHSGDVNAHGTIYYGEVYGKSRSTDTFYVLALIDQMYVWQKQGDGPWAYEGAYDARVCEPPVPLKLSAAWGVVDMFPHKHC